MDRILQAIIVNRNADAEHFFNIAGPSEARKHYLIDPLQRINIRQIETLIAQEYYFVLHAPRQTGKTSCLLALMEHLNQQARYQALYVNIETAQVARNDVARGNYTVAESIAMAADYYLQQDHLLAWLKTHDQPQQADNLVRHLLQYWSRQTEQPIVLLLDEVDALVGDTLNLTIAPDPGWLCPASAGVSGLYRVVRCARRA